MVSGTYGAGGAEMAIPVEHLTEEEMERLGERADAIYDGRLKAQLEPEHNGKVVGILVESGEYALGKNFPDAMRAIRRLRPEGFIVTRSVGSQQPDPTLDRILA